MAFRCFLFLQSLPKYFAPYVSLGEDSARAFLGQTCLRRQVWGHRGACLLFYEMQSLNRSNSSGSFASSWSFPPFGFLWLCWICFLNYWMYPQYFVYLSFVTFCTWTYLPWNFMWGDILRTGLHCFSKDVHSHGVEVKLAAACFSSVLRVSGFPSTQHQCRDSCSPCCSCSEVGFCFKAKMSDFWPHFGETSGFVSDAPSSVQLSKQKKKNSTLVPANSLLTAVDSVLQCQLSNALTKMHFGRFYPTSQLFLLGKLFSVPYVESWKRLATP